MKSMLIGIAGLLVFIFGLAAFFGKLPFASTLTPPYILVSTVVVVLGISLLFLSWGLQLKNFWAVMAIVFS